MIKENGYSWQSTGKKGRVVGTQIPDDGRIWRDLLNGIGGMTVSHGVGEGIGILFGT
jgi:hypothetical protein